MNSNFQTFGKWLVFAGVAGLTVGVIMNFTIYSGLDQGALPATAFLIIMIGVAFSSPTMLEESPGQLSTMRIIVFAVTMVFCVLYIKIGWNVGNFEQFSIDKTWIYILGLAFGSKVLQRFGEEEDSKDTKP